MAKPKRPAKEVLQKMFVIDGMPSKKIADILGVGLTSVNLWLIEYGIRKKGIGTRMRKIEVMPENMRDVAVGLLGK